MKRFAGLSFQPRSSLRGCLCFSLSHRRRFQSCTVAISTTHCTVHMSNMSVALRLGSVGTCNVSVSREWDGHGRSVGDRSVDRSVGRSVGRSVDARGPVDHDSVGLAQARPN